MTTTVPTYIYIYIYIYLFIKTLVIVQKWVLRQECRDYKCVRGPLWSESVAGNVVWQRKEMCCVVKQLLPCGCSHRKTVFFNAKIICILQRYVKETVPNIFMFLTMDGGDFVLFFFRLPPAPCRPTARQNRRARSFVQFKCFILLHFQFS